MYVAVIIIHILACLGLILIVLLQRGKGADLGAAFGGSSQTVFGSQGAGGFLARLTTISAVVFMFTCLGLAYMSSHRAQATVMESKEQAAVPSQQEATTEAPTESAAENQAPAAEQPAEAPAGAAGDSANSGTATGN
jgi:preprotein translocase subunit SecG